MGNPIDYDALDDALRRAGASWNAAQAHGFMSSRLAVEGMAAVPGSIAAILDAGDPANALRKECEGLLAGCMQQTHADLLERQSGFHPLLPDDEEDTERRTDALANWSEGYLHGLVSAKVDESLRKRLAAEPIDDIIKDLLQITRATAAADADDEGDEEAYAQIVEYLRVAAQLVYEELESSRPEPVQ